MQDEKKPAGGGSARAKKFKFNALDAVILLAVIAVAAAAVYFVGVFLSGRGEQGSVDFTYTVEIRNISGEFTDRIKKGDEVIDSISKKPLGTVEAVSYVPYSVLQYNELTGEAVMADFPDRYNVIITVSTAAELDEKGYSVNDYRITVGTALYMRLPEYVGMGYCIAIPQR